MRGGDQRGVVIPPQPGAAFVVVQAELAFELSVVELDLPTQPREPGEPAGLGRGREVGDPVVGRLGFAFGPLGDQPFLARRDLSSALVPTAAAVVRAPVIASATTSAANASARSRTAEDGSACSLASARVSPPSCPPRVGNTNAKKGSPPPRRTPTHRLTKYY